MWTADDDKVLLKLVKAHNGTFKEVALQMGRIREHCVARYYWLREHGAADDGTMLQGMHRVGPFESAEESESSSPGGFF